MKTGRNENCPCGSELKYKKCCLNKEKNINKYNFQSPYNNLIDYELLNKIIEIFNTYKFFDLCRAVFTINSYRSNRSNFSFSTTLNFALKVCEKTGESSIDDFTSFEQFFRQIKQIYSHSYMDDFLCPDFGEVKVNVLDKFQSVILGNGFNHSFSLYSISTYIAQELNKCEEFDIAFGFYGEMLNSLFKTNPYDETLDYANLYCPSEKFFNNVVDYYVLEKFNRNKELWSKVFNTGFIEQEHFLKYGNDLFFIFNTSFLIDFICSFLKERDNKQSSMIVSSSLGNLLQILFEDEHREGQVMWPIKVSFDNKVKTYVYAKAFLHEGDKNILIISENDLPKNQTIKDTTDCIINEMRNGKLYLFEPYEGRMLRGVNLPKDTNLIIVFCDDFIDLQETNCRFIEQENNNFILFLDLVHIIKRAKSISEIYDFLEYYLNCEKMFLNFCDGASGIFEIWKDQNGIIEQGALEFSSIGSDIYNKDFNIFNYYRNELIDYPYYPYSNLFIEPFGWEIKRIPNGPIYYSNKAIQGFGGTLIPYKDARYFFCHNINMYPDNIQIIAPEIENLKLLDEINCALFTHYFEDIMQCGGKCDVIQFLHIPYVAENKNLIELGKYSKGRFRVYSNLKQIIFSVDIHSLINDILKSENRSVEIEYFLELVKLIPDVDVDKISEKLNNEKSQEKISSIVQYNCKHYKSTVNIHNWAEEIDFIKVRKQIAYMCKDSGINDGHYEGKEALNIIREIQKVLQPFIENYLSQFDKVDLHKKLLSTAAFYVHSKNLNNKKYIKNRNDNHDDWARRCIMQREEDKEKIRFVSYLIETNLYVERNCETKIIKQEELQTLFAYSDWIVILQDYGDEFKWNFENISIEVLDDFRVDTLYDGEIEAQQKLGERIYRNNDYKPERDSKKELEVLIAKLSEDLGFSFSSMLNLINYCCMEFNYTFKTEDCPDVFVINKEQMLNDINQVLKDPGEIKDVKLALDYLIINSSNIKITYDKNGNKVVHDLIPIWEREQRIDRIDVKPFLQVDNNIIFSPTLMYDLLERWKSGIIQYYPPYEKGLDKYLAQTKIFKSECEKQMEKDIYNLMSTQKHEKDVCELNLDLHSRFPKSDYPDGLGDYDGLFIDTTNKVIWNIESKFLQHVGSISEFAKHQNTFFNKNSKDEKFEKRINYLNQNTSKILTDFGIEIEDYKILSYMVTNKVFISSFKKINVEIITYDEFNTIFNNFYSPLK